MKNRAAIAFLLIALSWTAYGASEEEIPLRMLLDEEFSWMDRRGADRLVETAKRAGFNAIVPCVWHGRGVTWTSTLPKEPRWEDNPFPLKDPLAYLISRAHSEGIEVHPWFTVMKRQRNFYHEYRDEGVPDQAFDVHNEAFQKFITNVVLDVVRKYNVDGINLDYIRSRGVCTSSNCQRLYKQQSGRDLIADNRTYRVFAPARKSIEEWNGQAVERLLTSISTSARQIKPGLVVSVGSHAFYKPLLLEGANSIKWANKGLIDLILHIEYAQIQSIRQELLNGALLSLDDPSKLIMIAGNYEFDPKNKSNVWPRDAEEVSKVVEFASRFNSKQSGVALYEYRFLTEEQIKAIATLWHKQSVQSQ